MLRNTVSSTAVREKNVGPAGVTFVIVRKDLLGQTGRNLQTMIDYRTHIGDEPRNNSMFNTPPVFPIFVMHETLKWVKELGGVEEMYKRNKQKSRASLQRNRPQLPLRRYRREGRPFAYERMLRNGSGSRGARERIHGVCQGEGHGRYQGTRSVGGFRASIYNACPLESVEALVACMQEFEKSAQVGRGLFRDIQA